MTIAALNGPQSCASDAWTNNYWVQKLRSRKDDYIATSS